MAKYRPKRNELEVELMKVDQKVRKYFRWKFDIPYGGVKMKQTTMEEICKFWGIKNPRYFYDWEKTSEYRHLVNVYLNSKTANDLLDIYNAVLDKAKTGNDKSIDTLLKLQKEIQANIKSAKRKEKEIDEDDGLEL